MTTEKSVGDMTLKELQEAEPLLFPKAIDQLTDKELSDKVDDVFEYLHHMPSDLSFTDSDLLKELKRRFDVTLTSRSTDDEELLAEFDEVLIESYPNHTVEVLGKVRDRLFDLTVVAEVTRKDLAGRLGSIISYPGNLSDSDVKTLEEVLGYLTPSTKI